MYQDTTTATTISSQTQAIDVNELINDLQEGNMSMKDLKTGVLEDGMIETKDGKRIPVMSLLARTGNQDFFRFTPSYTRESDGKYIPERLRISLLTDPDEYAEAEGRRYTSYPLTLWGKEARTAKQLLLDSGSVNALLYIHQARVSHYQDYRDPDILRFSLSINFASQWEVISMVDNSVDQTKVQKALATMRAAGEASDKAREGGPDFSGITDESLFPITSNTADTAF